ncbi:MAG: extracellular solute-binding protein [Ruminococcaceae bacterium]|nr:extracellular solute-binding protein [Oscillospiraceae bacterium]
MYKRSIIMLLAVALLITGVMVGCRGTGGESGSSAGNSGQSNTGNQTAEEVKLVLWGAADDQKMLREMAEAFKAEHSDRRISIDIRVCGEDVARDEALKDIDAAADVFAITNDQLGALVNAGAVYENTKYADEVRETRTESAVAAAMVGDKMYGYPSSSETYFLFYDKSKLSEEDVESMEGILAVKQDEGVTKMGFDFGDAYFSSAFFLTAGSKIYGENGQDPSSVTFNTENGIQAAKYIASLKAKGVEDMEGDVAGSRFAADKLAAFVSGNWKTEAYSEALGDNLGMAKLPTINIGGDDRDMVSFSGGKMYVVKSTTKHPLEAMALAAFLTNEENQLKRFRERNLLPNNQLLARNEEILEDDATEAQVEQFAHSIPTPSITQMSKYWEPVGAFTKDCFDGKIAEKDMKSRLDTLVKDITAQ